MKNVLLKDADSCDRAQRGVGMMGVAPGGVGLLFRLSCWLAGSTVFIPAAGMF